MRKTKLAGLSVLAFLLSSCQSAAYLSKPSDTNLEFWLTQDVTNQDFSSHVSPGGYFGASAYYGKDYQTDAKSYVIYVVTGYPDYADNKKAITGITITDPAITFYSLSLASSQADFDQVMKKTRIYPGCRSLGNKEQPHFPLHPVAVVCADGQSLQPRAAGVLEKAGIHDHHDSSSLRSRITWPRLFRLDICRLKVYPISRE
jgi:hypothetical protein